MMYRINVWLLLIALWVTFPVTAQSRSGTPTTSDTIYFSQTCHGNFTSLVPSIGDVILFDLKYTLVRSGTTVLCQKYISYCNNDCSNFLVATSDWFECKDDTLFSWLIPQLNTIKKEEIVPIIYHFKGDSLNLYDQFSPSHMFYSNKVIAIPTQQGTIKKTVNPRYWTATLREGEITNLNYLYNTSTKLYQLFNMLEQRCEAWDGLFKFPPSK